MLRPLSEKIEAIGSQIEVFFLEEKFRINVSGALQQVKNFNDDFSRFINKNQLSTLNSRRGEWQNVSEEMLFLLKKSWEFYQLTDGYFNIGMAEELENLGYDQNYSFEAKVQKNVALEKLKIFFDESWGVKVNKKIEFGGLGKGHVLDFVGNFLKKNGLDNFLINAGGDIYAFGTGVEGKGWKVVLENPENNNFGIGEIYCSDLFLAASSASKRKWKNSHHLLNESGNPAEDMLGVFVQADQGILADAMATSLYVMGMEKGREVLPRLGVEALLIDKNGKIYKTEGFTANFY